MITYNIVFKDDVSVVQRIFFYEDLRNKVLSKDKVWHFFWEGDFDHIRINETSECRLVTYLSKSDKLAHWYCLGKWDDDHEIVNKYKDYFVDIFHANSLLALSIHISDIKHNRLQLISDRVIHSMFNMLTYPLKDAMPSKTSGGVEAEVLAFQAIDRAYYNGYYFAYQQAKEASEKANANTDVSKT